MTLPYMGNGLPHQCAHWLAMTVVSGTTPVILSGGRSPGSKNPFLSCLRRRILRLAALAQDDTFGDSLS